MIIREMEWTDIPSGLSLCRSAGWNQLSRDWEIFLTLNPRGNRVCLDDDGKVIATVTTIRYDNRVAWIGMVLVDPAHRRRGIGHRLLEEAGRILEGVDCIKLDATPAGREVYIRLGFADEYALSRMSARSINMLPLIHSPDVSVLQAHDLGLVNSVDRDVFGSGRMSLISWMREGAPELAFKVFDGGILKGYCLGRSGYQYTHIGPVVADSFDVAKALVSAALRRCGSHPVILDVPDHDVLWMEWLESLGFSTLRPFIRMFKGNNRHPGMPEKQYAMLGPEFG